MRMKWACVAIAGLLVLPMSVDAAKRGKKKKVVYEEETEEEYEEEGVTSYGGDAGANGLTFSIGLGLAGRHWPSPTEQLVLNKGGKAPDGITDTDTAPPVPNVTIPGVRVGYKMNQLIAHGTIDFVSLGAVNGPRGYCVKEDKAFEASCETWASRQTTFGALTLGAGARYLFAAAAEKTVVPYATGTLLFLVPMAGHNNPDFQTALDKAYSGMSWGITVGGGAEYFLASGFSIGGEAGISHVSVGLSEGNSAQMMTQIYSSLQFNFYL